MRCISQCELYGLPQFLQHGVWVLLQVWTYLVKHYGHKKARNCFFRSFIVKHQTNYPQTYAACVSQVDTSIILISALTALKNYPILRTYVINAFVWSPSPFKPTLVYINNHYVNGTITTEEIKYIVVAAYVLQCHHETGRLCSKIDYTTTTHNRTLYHDILEGHDVLVCCPVFVS